MTMPADVAIDDIAAACFSARRSQLRIAAAWAASCELGSYLAGDSTVSLSVPLTGVTGRVELTVQVDESGRLVRCAVALAG
jgi:hypothetical protein